LTLQDQVVLVAKETHAHFQELLDLDMLSFESLHNSCLRLMAQRTRENAWVAMMAAQGTVKGMKELEKQWVKLSELDLAPEGATDIAKFLAKHGKGI
jgi:hypothetical protein